MERRGLLARLSDVESEIHSTRKEMHAEAMRKLLYEGDEITMGTVLIHEQILDKLSQLRESWDAEDDVRRP